MAKLLELIAVLGPKMKDALPLILALIKLLAPNSGLQYGQGTAVAASQAAPVSAQRQKFVEAAVQNGAGEEEAHELAQMVERAEDNQPA